MSKAMNEKEVRHDRARGMLWGLIVGDCMGSPIQFSGKDAHEWITEMEVCPVFGLPPGYWTDDGSMALCIMDSYVRKGGYDLRDVGATFVKWLREGYLSSVEGKAFDVGGATYDGVGAIARGSLVNGEEESQGNGSLMRFAPSYLIARAEGRDEIMHEVSDLTHASRKVRAVCDEMAGILDLHLKGERYEDTLAAGLERAKVPNSGWVVDTMVAAKWAFVTTQTFEEGMIAAVNLGGDSDSIGAVFGQMAGAYYGYRAIPERWVKEVKDWKKVDKWIEDFLAAVEM